MEFVQKFTPPDFQAKNFTPSISPNFNSFSGKKHKKWVKMEKFTLLAKVLHSRQDWRDGQIPPLGHQQLSGKSVKYSTDSRGGIRHCRHCRRQCKIFASGVNFSIFTHFLCFFPLTLLKLGEIDGVKFLAWKSGGVNFLTNSMSAWKNGLEWDWIV